MPLKPASTSIRLLLSDRKAGGLISNPIAFAATTQKKNHITMHVLTQLTDSLIRDDICVEGTSHRFVHVV